VEIHFTPLSLYPAPMNGVLGGLLNHCVRYGEERNVMPLLVIEPLLFGFPPVRLNEEKELISETMQFEKAHECRENAK
jgi:hypothetical protein